MEEESEQELCHCRETRTSEGRDFIMQNGGNRQRIAKINFFSSILSLGLHDTFWQFFLIGPKYFGVVAG